MSTICLAQRLVYEHSIYGNYFYHPTCNFIKIMALVVQDISLVVTHSNQTDYNFLPTRNAL